MSWIAPSRSHYTTPRLSPQTRQIVKFLLKYGSITNVEANSILRVRSVSRRVTELKDAGIHLRKEWKEDTFGQKYVRYHLERNDYLWLSRVFPELTETNACAKSH